VPEGTARFLATVGVDDAAGRRGSVVFRVLVDGEEVFATEALSAADPARLVSLDIGGAATLTLIAEPGDPFHPEAGFADWAEARITLASPR
jgi:hypothetical protein